MKVFFSVGEPSGDLHGANLIRALRERSGEPIEAVGYGGPRMADAGARLHYDLTQLAVMGLFEVLRKLPKFFRLKWRAQRYFRDHRPDAVVLIDFPGFNWHIAQVAKRHGVPVYYYGTPQVWGWASWRVKRLRRYVDHALCKLPFEEPWLRERGVNATHVGHPYFDELSTRKLDEAFVRRERDAPGDLVALLPGSRTQEVRANFP
ncbi:MAG: lipid-A-disaccharide synthase, partial [Planctomycetota bacterium]